MAEGRRPLSPFAVRVQADWGTPEPPKQLRNKLLLYFQSRKKSGGGECEIQLQSGQVLVWFAKEEVRQRVLSKETHELDLEGKGALKLVVTQHEKTAKENVPKKETDLHQASRGEDVAEETDALERDLQKEDIIANRSTHETPCHKEDILTKSHTSSRVILENVEEYFDKPDVLNLLVENISGLSGGSDFEIELISERNAAVITFQQSIDAANFVAQCPRNVRFKEFKITVKPLELTQTIKVENIPSGVPKDFLILYFESSKHGGGQVSGIQMSPEENSAIVTFCDHQAVLAALEKQHFFDNQPVSVYPYYGSLDMVLYGKERAEIKMLHPLRVPLDPYIWQFIQGKDGLVKEINQEMAKCHSELMWPQATCKQPEVVMHPSAALSKQGRSMRELIKTWKDKVSMEFTRIMSKFKAVQCKIIPAAWPTIENNLIKDVLAVWDVSKETVTLAGFVFTVDGVKKSINEYMENLTKDAERAKQTIRETLAVTPGKYAVLHQVLLEENVYKENPDLKFSYDTSAEMVQLSGMVAEVYKMKCALQEKLYNIKEKKVNTHPAIFQFLQHANSRKVTVIIFGANKINASYELQYDSVTLVGYLDDSLLKAEEQMKKDLANKSIGLVNRELVNKREWKELIERLHKKHNSVEVAFIIDVCLTLEEEAKVTIAGYTKAVVDVYQVLSDFIEKNTQIQKVIPAKAVVVVQFMEKEKGKVWQNLRKNGLKINFGQQAQKNIILSGPRIDVMKAAAVVEQELSLLHFVSVTFDKPGVKNFFKNREHSYITEAKQSFHCLIRLQKEGEEKGNFDEKLGHPHAKIILKHGVVIEAQKGDLTRYSVDVVVNASNEDLKHIGGLADALLKVAGPQLQSECDDLVRNHGRLKPGRAVRTGAWNLPCKEVIHAVGPRWNTSEKEKCTRLLKEAVKRSLNLAETYNHRSIAIPAISSGIFGFPLKECAHTIVASIKEHLEETSESGCLKQICLVDVSDNTVQALADALNEIFREGSPKPRLLPKSKSLLNQPKEIGENVHVVTSAEGVKLILEEKGIEDATTDIVVSSIGTDLKLGVGPLSKAVLQKAGPMLQVEFDQAVQSQGAQGSCVIQTGGYNLACSIVLHAVIPQWDAGKGPAIQKLKDIVRECLEKTEQLSLSSVSFPALGTGGFSFPKSEVAKLMFEEVLQFSSRKNLKSLQEVRFLLHPNDKENKQVFSQVFSQVGGIHRGVPPSDGESTGFFGPVSTPSLGIHEMQIGSVLFQVVTGDITKENTDVIVNLTNSTFDSKTGVSKAILEGGGPQVAAECALHGMTQQTAFHSAICSQSHSGFITTQAGNLVCKKIIHLAPNSDTKAQISKVLHECEAKKYTSVAFPAIGTGQAGKNPADAADDMMGAVADFVGKVPLQYLQMIKIVIFQPHMQNAFYASMKTREGAALPTSESMFSKFKKFVLGKKTPARKKHHLVVEKKVEVAVFEICGESKENVQEAKSWLKEMILREQTEKLISDESIDLFDDEKIKELNNLQKRLHIAIQLERKQSPPFILISGIPRDVLEAYSQIDDLVKKIKRDREEQSKAELAHNLVEWQYSTKGNDFAPFDKLSNLHLEDARMSKKSINIQIRGRSYTVDTINMHAVDGQGQTVNIKRIVKEEGGPSVPVPTQWEDMKGHRVKVVLLQPAAAEYKEVEKKFRSSCPANKIEKIERVQNPYLWNSYQLKKQDMDKKNSHNRNELILFHGTPASTVTPINHTGFNRSYAGKNAAAIGNGTYFAVQASYSANDAYSTPDTNGRKYMYLARVLTGDYCAGKPGLIIPPPKGNGGIELYDSVTDNMARPSMFVTFYDSQAYPEYLITFRR
ncbi:protein mono-ADP-ribosyltransferase PARP14 [Lacerta agilis]|uniref:protein mono-ADP-ribosyltransferase PARP14 n=1 Tax=Lacerta agilis TaxID=80427 RepID=UPI00141987CA|nr:protein mono-ADP-ribosyltransferase PARP14 [Lacerta agilis]